MVIGASSYFGLPNSIETASFLTSEQKAHARRRLDEENSAHEPFSWDEVKRGFFNVQVWLSALAYFSILCKKTCYV